jgi:hypothetical protein
MRLIAAGAALVLVAAAPAAADHHRRAFCAAIIDNQLGYVETTTGEPWRDLRGAAIGSDARDVTVAFTLSALPAMPSRTEHALVEYRMGFTVRGQEVFLNAPAHEGVAASYGVRLGVREVVLGQARVVRDRKRNQLRVTAPVAGFAPFADLRPGATAARLNAHVFLTPHVPSTPSVVITPGMIVDSVEDENREKKTYRLGSLSCVSVGR